MKPPIELIKPIVRKETHKEVDFAHVPQSHGDSDFHFLDRPVSK